MSNPIDQHYPIPCAFCNISSAYPPSSSSPVPTSPNPENVSPQCHLILSTPHVLAFLDIMPMAPGHILLTSRNHYEKLSDLQGDDTARETSRALGEWLPVVSRALCAVTGIEDWNVVQNNGARAAQVVPHIHFHLIPRYQEGRGDRANKGEKGDVTLGKSWKMFGRGAREDLDDEEGAELAGKLREAVKADLEGGKGRSKL